MMTMRVLHLAAGNRWTGAAAPAFAETAALREAGVEAHYAYVAGYKLEQKLWDVEFAHPIIAKAQNPVSFVRTLKAIRALVRERGIDVVHAHLTYDHVLARFVGGVRVVRTFHSRRVIRGDVLTRSLIGRTDALCVINSTLSVRGREVHFTPPPLDTRQFTPIGANVRAVYGLPDDAFVLTAIGKLDPARGFEEVLRTFALVRGARPGARLMIIGHGPHRPALEALSRELGVDGALTWAGYHEDDLAEHYRAANVLLFTAKGSDEGHRAVIEAMACGVAPATYPIDGIRAIVGELPAISASATPEALSELVVAMPDVREQAVARAGEFSYARAAERLVAVYSMGRMGRSQVP